MGLDCGPRCANVWVFQFVSTTADGSPPTEYGGFYECKVNVSNVTNAVLAEHHLSDEIAARAAGSIGLNGFTDTRVENEMQYQSNLYSVA